MSGGPVRAAGVAEARLRGIGLAHGALAYGLWGVVPVYWKLLAHVAPIELIAHRALWGLLAFLAIVAGAAQWRVLARSMRDVRLVGMMAISGGLLAVNWGVFVWATLSGHLLDASLGYFINPLLSVALGTIVLGERLRALQWLAIALAAAGVGLLTWRAGRVPWVALLLAATFALYGLVRKTARVDALVGSAMETVLLAPVASDRSSDRLGQVVAHRATAPDRSTGSERARLRPGGRGPCSGGRKSGGVEPLPAKR